MTRRGRAWRACGLLTLCAFLAGCTTYRTVAVPNPAVDAHADEAVPVEPGATIVLFATVILVGVVTAFGAGGGGTFAAD